MPLGFRSPVLGQSAKRAQFLNAARSITGTKPVACYLPSFTDSLTSIDPISGRLWTAEAAMNGQIKPQGYGFYRTFNNTSNYLSTPDTNDLSFGNGTTDSAFSCFAVVKWTSGTAQRVMAKMNSGTLAIEWHFDIGGTGLLSLQLADQSVGVTAIRASNAGPTAGAWTSWGSTYTAATGGATAANDITIYQAGAALASTATNQATYVAMENLAALGTVGAAADPAGFFNGSIACTLLVLGALSAAQHASLHAAARTFFGI